MLLESVDVCVYIGCEIKSVPSYVIYSHFLLSGF